VESGQVESVEELAQLLDHAVISPETDIVRGVGLPGAELVVEHHRAVVGQGLERFQVVVGRPWTAMDGDERDRLAVTDDAVPDPATGNLDPPSRASTAAVMRPPS